MRRSHKRASSHGDFEQEIRISTKQHRRLTAVGCMEDQGFGVGDAES